VHLRFRWFRGLYALILDRPRLLALLTVLGAAFYPVVRRCWAKPVSIVVLPAQLRSSIQTSERW